jgi:hypothetical protein
MTLGAFALAGGVARGPGSGDVAWIATASAQDASELAAARKTFTEALADQAAQRFTIALEKFQRVQAVRDTQAVRYRIATCLEALGKLRAALEAYTAASVAAGNDAESTNIARVSREKMDVLSTRVARVVVKLSPQAPDDAVVKIDGEVLQANAIGTPVVIDPGVHEITATGSGAAPFRAQTTITEGGTATVYVVIDAPRHAPPLPPMETLPGASGAPSASPSKPAPSDAEPAGSPSEPSSGRTTAGVVAVTAGGVLIAGSIVLVLVRHAEITSLDNACPGGVCPIARQSELESTRSRALLEGPAAIGVGAAGVIAAGVGIVLLATTGTSHATAFVPWVDRETRGVAWSAKF